MSGFCDAEIMYVYIYMKFYSTPVYHEESLQTLKSNRIKRVRKGERESESPNNINSKNKSNYDC